MFASALGLGRDDVIVRDPEIFIATLLSTSARGLPKN
jgi:hypothetical protein